MDTSIIELTKACRVEKACPLSVFENFPHFVLGKMAQQSVVGQSFESYGWT